MRFHYVAVQEVYDATDRARVTYEPPASVYEPLVTEQRLTRADYDAWVQEVLHKEVNHGEAVGRKIAWHSHRKAEHR